MVISISFFPVVTRLHVGDTTVEDGPLCTTEVVLDSSMEYIPTTSLLSLLSVKGASAFCASTGILLLPPAGRRGGAGSFWVFFAFPFPDNDEADADEDED